MTMTDNILSYQKLGWILNHSEEGLFLLTASAKMQAAILARYSGANMTVYDYQAQEAYTFERLSEWMEKYPDVRAYFLQNFQNALTGSPEAACKRLNFSRDMLARMGKNIIFCMTKEADDLLCREACDFYAYIGLPIDFADELTKEDAAPLPRSEESDWHVQDQSTGVAVDTDWSKPKEKLLASAIAFTHQGQELAAAFRFADARRLLQSALEIRERLLGMDHPDTAETCQDIASVCQDEGDYDSALEWYDRALEIVKNTLGEGSSRAATLYNNIATVLQSQGHLASALTLFQKAQAVYESSLGAEHPETADVYSNLGMLYYDLGDYGQAHQWCAKALDVYEKMPEPDELDIANVDNNIALLYHAQGKFSQALQWYREALDIEEKVLGRLHPGIASTYNNIASLYESQGDYAEALSWYGKALIIREEKLGKEHPDTATVYNNIAGAYLRMGKEKQALPYFEKAYAILRKKLGETHRYTQSTKRGVLYCKGKGK